MAVQFSYTRPRELLRSMVWTDVQRRCLPMDRACWQGWERRRFIAVQWRTETSRGNLTQCYDRYVGPAVEEHRLRRGLGRNQVYFNTDLVGRTSGTYRRSVRCDCCHVGRHRENGVDDATESWGSFPSCSSTSRMAVDMNVS